MYQRSVFIPMEKINNVTAKKKTSKFDSIFKKLKSIKNIELIIAAIFIGIILIIFFSGSLFGGEKDETVIFKLNEYGSALEKKMEKILSDINGAGKVSVMITFDSGVEIITASTVSKQSNTVIDDYSGLQGNKIGKETTVR